MSWTADTFLTQYPSFAEIYGAREDGVVAAKLAEAALVVDAAVWGAKADLGVGLMAAHLLSLQPMWDGKIAPWVTARRTSYLDAFEAQARNVGRAYRIVLYEDEVE